MCPCQNSNNKNAHISRHKKKEEKNSGTAKMPTGRSKSLVLSRKLALLKCIHGVLKTNRQAARQKDTETERRET